MYGVFGTNTILVQIEMYTAFQYQETDAHYLYLCARVLCHLYFSKNVKQSKVRETSFLCAILTHPTADMVSYTTLFA